MQRLIPVTTVLIILLGSALMAQESKVSSLWKKSDSATKELLTILGEAGGDIDFQKLLDTDPSIEFAVFSAYKDKVIDLGEKTKLPNSLAKELFSKTSTDFDFYASNRALSDDEEEKIENNFAKTIKPKSGNGDYVFKTYTQTHQVCK
jgi:hypothetical protein